MTLNGEEVFVYHYFFFKAFFGIVPNQLSDFFTTFAEPGDV